jgi:hypothetical protein
MPRSLVVVSFASVVELRVLRDEYATRCGVAVNKIKIIKILFDT